MGRLHDQRAKLVAAALAGALIFSPATALANETSSPTPSSSASSATPTPTKGSAFERYAAANPTVGKAKGSEKTVSGGSIRHYENATLTLRTGGAVIPVIGGISEMWTTNGGANTLGLPSTGEIRARGGVYQVFENATIGWHPTAGAAVVANGVRTVWLNEGGVDGFLGLPVSGEVPTPGGVIQHFQGGAISWSRAGSRVISGGIYNNWKAASFLGAALTSEESFGDGVFQTFENGMISWHPSVGAWVISGGIAEMWRSNQWLGAPRSPEYQLRGGAVQFFQNGAVTWHPSFGAYTVGGAIGTQWLDRWHIWELGYPISSEIKVGEGAYQRFEQGVLQWNTQGMYPVHGAIGSYWNSQGGAQGRFGPAIGPEECIQHSCAQKFQNGVITWNAATGARQGELLDRRCWYGRVACADKSTNQLYWVVDGRIIKTMDARFGRPGMDTSEGDFPLLRKVRMDWSVPYSGWMPFSLYFTNWGEAIHHSSGFEQLGHPSLGSHGCINMASWEDSEWLFDQMQMGDRIVVYRS